MKKSGNGMNLANAGYEVIDHRKEGGVEEPVSLKDVLHAGSSSGQKCPDFVHLRQSRPKEELGADERIKPNPLTSIIRALPMIYSELDFSCTLLPIMLYTRNVCNMHSIGESYIQGLLVDERISTTLLRMKLNGNSSSIAIRERMHPIRRRY